MNHQIQKFSVMGQDTLSYWLKTGIRPNMTKISDPEVKDQHKQTKRIGINQSMP